jgi:hypothetical protein
MNEQRPAPARRAPDPEPSSSSRIPDAAEILHLVLRHIGGAQFLLRVGEPDVAALELGMLEGELREILDTIEKDAA